jgi:uncharacterized protein (DUF1499 family)
MIRLPQSDTYFIELFFAKGNIMKNRLAQGVMMTIVTALLTACAGERPQNLGLRDGVLTSCPASPNCVSSYATDERHRIAPFSFNSAPDAAFSRLKQILSQRGDVTVVAEQVGYLHVEFHTRLFVDDGEFLLDREHQVIQVRSASRLGYSDLGKNRSRMEEIRQALSAQFDSAL